MIRKLPPHVIQNIAAGELVERPSSILKELVENSIDAGASQIKIEQEQGGIKSLRVSDNGRGIVADQLELVFESHATSKIQTVEDLSQIRSMGFRGEAMSSIASVARVEMWTTAHTADTGSRVQIEFGRWLGKLPADRREGTEVHVRDLFEKLPARRKFLKSENSEARQLYQVFKRYALAYPEIHWSYSDSKKSKLLLGPSNFFERALWYFDSDRKTDFFEVEHSRADWKIYFVGLKPRMLSPNRQGIQIFLNRRPIKDRSLDFAVRRAFEGFAERTSEALGVLLIEGNPEKFDVNVHPSKTEVRFQEVDVLFSTIVRGIRSKLESLHQTEEVFKMPVASPLTLTASKSTNGEIRNFQSSPLETPALQEQKLYAEPLFQSRYEFLGTVENTYWITKKNEQLYLFDQHALHERILYEKLLKDFQSNARIPSQRLLFPIQIQFENADELLEKEELLSKLGFEVRQWRSSGIQLLAVPAILKKDHAAALRSILECEEEAEESYLREILATIACHSALRAHDPVQDLQAEELLRQFSSDDALGHCPHGRPTFVGIDGLQLEKFFHRS